jgi:hypothetical protein
VPWIVKKKVIIGGEKKESGNSDPVKLLEMNIPVAMEDDLFKGSLINAFEDYEPVMKDDPFNRKNSLKESDFDFDYSPEIVKTYREEDYVKGEPDVFENEEFFDEEEALPEYDDFSEEPLRDEESTVKFSREEYEVRINRIFGIDTEGDNNPEEEQIIAYAGAPDRNKRF